MDTIRDAVLTVNFYWGMVAQLELQYQPNKLDVQLMESILQEADVYMICAVGLYYLPYMIWDWVVILYMYMNNNGGDTTTTTNVAGKGRAEQSLEVESHFAYLLVLIHASSFLTSKSLLKTPVKDVEVVLVLAAVIITAWVNKNPYEWFPHHLITWCAIGDFISNVSILVTLKNKWEFVQRFARYIPELNGVLMVVPVILTFPLVGGLELWMLLYIAFLAQVITPAVTNNQREKAVQVAQTIYQNDTYYPGKHFLLGPSTRTYASLQAGPREEEAAPPVIPIVVLPPPTQTTTTTTQEDDIHVL